MTYERDPMDYCPLCGAHQFEAEEGEANDEKILSMAEMIETLHERLQRIKDAQ